MAFRNWRKEKESTEYEEDGGDDVSESQTKDEYVVWMFEVGGMGYEDVEDKSVAQMAAMAMKENSTYVNDVFPSSAILRKEKCV